MVKIAELSVYLLVLRQWLCSHPTNVSELWHVVSKMLEGNSKDRIRFSLCACERALCFCLIKLSAVKLWWKLETSKQHDTTKLTVLGLCQRLKTSYNVLNVMPLSVFCFFKNRNKFILTFAGPAGNLSYCPQVWRGNLSHLPTPPLPPASSSLSPCPPLRPPQMLPPPGITESGFLPGWYLDWCWKDSWTFVWGWGG